MSNEEFEEFIKTNCTSSASFYEAIMDEWDNLTREQQMFIAVQGLGYLDDGQVYDLGKETLEHFDLDSVF